MQGFALTTEQIIEILSVYSTPEREIEAVAATPGWNVIGAFVMPASADILVDIMGSVSVDSLTLRVRLYDITPGSIGVVSGSIAQLNSETDVQAYSGRITLQGGHKYQFQAEVTGGSGDGFFGVLRRAQLAGQE